MMTKNFSVRQHAISLGAAFAMLVANAPIAIGADYFISTQADFDMYRQATFAPGDNILFERGKVFNGMFSPTTVGAAGNVITISSYGTGNKPVVNNNGAIHPHPTRPGATVSAGVLLFNAEYVELKNLEITNNNGGNQTEDLFGIYVLGEDTGKIHNHIHIEDNYVHHVNGAVAGKRRGGIHLHGYSPTTSNTATYNDVRIVNNVVDQIGGVGIGTDIDDVVDAHDFTGASRENAITDLYVAHNWVGNTGRNSFIARDADYAVYEYNTSANSSRHDKGHSFFNFRTLGLTFQYNEAYGNKGTGEADRGGFDADYNSKDTVIQYNYSHDNDWFAAVMKRPNTNVTIRYNLSVNDKKGAYFYGFESETDVTNVDVYNNTHYFDSSISPNMIVLDRTPHETTFKNNILFAEGSGTAGIDADNGTNVVYDTNVYYNFTPPISEVNALTANPLFVSPGAEPFDVDMQFGRDVLAGYQLSENSPYIGAGLAIPNNGGLDFWGNPTPLGATDIGASEAGTNPTITILTGNVFPATAEATVIAANPDQGAFGQDAPISMTQTFQVDTTFDLQKIFLDYEYDPAADPSTIEISVEIFEVADVSASSLTAGTSIWTINALSMPVIASDEEAAIILDTPVTLPVTTGSAGYGLRITNGGDPGFEWRRTGNTTGSVFPNGQAYEDGAKKLDGLRDYVLALASVEETVSLNADFDGSGLVDGSDLMIWQLNYSRGTTQSEGDANGDGTVDSADLDVWRTQFGSPPPLASLAVVPEPKTLVLTLTLLSIANGNGTLAAVFFKEAR